MTTHATRPLTSATAISDAYALADGAAIRAGVSVRLLDDNDELRTAAETLASIWGTQPGAYPVAADMMRALLHCESYIAGVFSEGVMVGASVGFLSGISQLALHSHITGLLDTHRNTGAGFAVKIHQRAWAIERGIDEIAWTFDPLQRRNVYFNVTKLGARVAKYYPDFYGEMRDSINVGDRSDRLLAKWEINSPRVVTALDGKHFEAVEIDNSGQDERIMLGIEPGGRPRVISELGTHVFVPSEFSALRAADPQTGLAWRLAIRDAFTRQHAMGRELAVVTPTGWYVFQEATV